MTLIILSEQEMKKFGAWLKQEAATAEGLATQMEKINVPSALIQKQRIEAAACRLIAHRFDHTEVFGIKG